MKTIEILVPDDFTEEQVEFIKRSALAQVKAEIEKELVVPKEIADAVKAKVDAVTAATTATLK